eukprot:scaffold28188_cov22-Tisochrysis_lutea.AAC.1
MAQRAVLCSTESPPPGGNRKLRWTWWVPDNTWLQGTRVVVRFFIFSLVECMGSTYNFIHNQEDCVENSL